MPDWRITDVCQWGYSSGRWHLAVAADGRALASGQHLIHNRHVVALRTAEPQRALISDAAGSERSARLTWHPEVGRFTLTHWDGRVCIASIQVAPEDAADLLAVLAEGLADSRPTWLVVDD